MRNWELPFLRATHTQRDTGKGEWVIGLTKHEWTLASRGLLVNGQPREGRIRNRLLTMGVRVFRGSSARIPAGKMFIAGLPDKTAVQTNWHWFG